MLNVFGPIDVAAPYRMVAEGTGFGKEDRKALSCQHFKMAGSNDPYKYDSSRPDKVVRAAEATFAGKEEVKFEVTTHRGNETKTVRREDLWNIDADGKPQGLMRHHGNQLLGISNSDFDEYQNVLADWSVACNHRCNTYSSLRQLGSVAFLGFGLAMLFRKINWKVGVPGVVGSAVLAGTMTIKHRQNASNAAFFKAVSLSSRWEELGRTRDGDWARYQRNDGSSWYYQKPRGAKISPKLMDSEDRWVNRFEEQYQVRQQVGVWSATSVREAVGRGFVRNPLPEVD